MMKVTKAITGVSDSCRTITLPEMLTETLQQETRYDYHWCSAVKILSRIASAAGLFLSLVLAVLSYESVAVPNQSPLLLMSLMLVCFGFFMSEIYCERKRKQHRLMIKLQNHAVAVAPALMLMHHEQESQVMHAASQILKTHLPMLREEDYPLFNTPQRASLCSLLRSADREITQAAAGAIGYVGD